MPFPGVPRAARASLRAGPGSGTPLGFSRAGVTRLSPRVPAPGAPADAAGSGESWGGREGGREGSLPVLLLPSTPLRSSHNRGWGLCAPERLRVGCSSSEHLCSRCCLRLFCHPAAPRGVFCHLPPSEHPEGWDSFLCAPGPLCALCPSPPPLPGMSRMRLLPPFPSSPRWLLRDGDGVGQSAVLIDTAPGLTLPCPLIFPGSFLAAGCVILFSLV